MLREGEQRRQVEVAALGARSAEDQRREPIVVPIRAFAVHEGADHGGARLFVAQVPEERKEDVGVVLFVLRRLKYKSPKSEARSFGCLRSSHNGKTVLKLYCPLCSA